MKSCLAHAVLSLALWLPGAAALAAPRPGCGDTPEPAETYIFRAQQAQSRGDHATTADALWNAWCKTGDARHLVGICEEQVQTRDLGRAAETVRYAEHRLAGTSGTGDIRQALESCKQKLPQAAGAGPQGQAANVGATPAPAPVTAAPAQAGGARPGCKDATEPAQTYLSRAQQAQSRGDHAGAADALWGAWCTTGEMRHLVGICDEQTRAGRPGQAAEILRYAERRLAVAGGSAAEQANARQALQDCRQRASLAPAGGGAQATSPGAASAPAAAAPAPAVAAPAKAGGARPGCKDAAESAEAYLSRVQQAQSRGDHAGAADALWGAWCTTGDLQHLVRICDEQVQARQPGQVADIVRYAEHRLAGGGAEQGRVRQELKDCQQRMSAASAAPPAQAAQAGGLPPAASATQSAASVSVIIQSTPPEARVYVDGRLHGIRGTPVCLGLSPGSHDLRLERPGHRPVSRQITVDREARLDFTLQPQ